MEDKLNIALIQKQLTSFELTNQELVGIQTILNFLIDYPDRLSWRSKNKPNLEQLNGQVQVAERYIKGRRKPSIPSMPKTVPDPATSLVLVHFFNYNINDTEKMKLEHQHSMSAENIIGALLEEYIYGIGKDHGWVQCCGSVVKAIDFIKADEKQGWIQLQVKNRDNTENSSSSQVRKGTTILHWFRTKAKTGETNWNNFPDELLRSLLSEEGFHEFVISKMKNC